MKRRICLVFVLFSILAIKSFSQEDKFKALFMYNFTKYLQWPADKEQGDFVIGVFGASPIIEELDVISQKRKVGNRNLTVKTIDSIDEIKKCNIVYFPENKSSKAIELYPQCSNSGVVLITDKPGLGEKVAGINYILKDGKQQFEINKTHLEMQGVKVNSALLTLGIPVN